VNERNSEDMEQFEYFSEFKIPEGNYLVMRADGRTFHSITEKLGLEKPFDKRLRDMMVSTVAKLMESNEFNIVLAYIQSDEISLAFKNSNIFNGRIEKLNSIIAAYISVELNKELARDGFGQLIDAHSLTIIFDSRIIVLPTLEVVKKYFLNRQKNCMNNALHSYCYYSLRQNGVNQTQAEKMLNEMKTDGKKEMLRVKFGIIFDEIPLWQRLGTVLYFELFKKQAVNQKTHEKVEVYRKRILIKEADDFIQKRDILNDIINQAFM
jgi:tRNA(His) 5'-end guanylyltransferase